MPEPPPYPGPRNDTDVRSTPAPSGMPRWAKVFIIVAIVLAMAFVVSVLLGIEHGPRMH